MPDEGVLDMAPSDFLRIAVIAAIEDAGKSIVEYMEQSRRHDY